MSFTRSTLFRAGAAALTAIVCAWFVVGIRQAHDTAKASSTLSGTTPLNPVQAGHVAALLRGAKLLNPDKQVGMLRGELAIRRHDFAAARSILGEVASAEPMNLQAWVWLARASSDDPAAFLRALVHISQLEPTVRKKR